MIGIIDYGMGNVGSLLNMVERLGEPAMTIDVPDRLPEAGKLILPGVGSFDNGVNKLRAKGMWDALDDYVRNKKIPILCICLGMQLVTRGSEEGNAAGFGWIDAECIHFRNMDKKMRIPHMGWNTIKVLRKSQLLEDVPPDPRFYFVHSYFISCNDKNDIVALTSYGNEFVSIIARDNIYATQFHPEKSHKFGLGLINSFLHLC